MRKDSYMQIFNRMWKQEFIEGLKDIHKQKKLRARQIAKAACSFDRHIRVWRKTIELRH